MPMLTMGLRGSRGARRAGRGTTSTARRRRCASRPTGSGPSLGNGAPASAQLLQQSPDRHESRTGPARPRSRARRPHRPAPARADGSQAGPPRGPQRDDARDEVRAALARTRAKWPPRLWPMIAARWPWRSTSDLDLLRARWTAASEQSTFIGCPPASRSGSCSAASASSAPANRRPRGSPESEDGLAAAVLTPSPRKTGSRSERREFEAYTDSRQSGGRERRESAVIRPCRPQYPLNGMGRAKNAFGAYA